VIDFGTLHSGHALVIRQEDLAEEIFLKQRAVEAVKKLEQKRLEIRWLLEAGAAVEPGLRRGELRIRRALVIR
jgi:hypothetical protein